MSSDMKFIIGELLIKHFPILEKFIPWLTMKDYDTIVTYQQSRYKNETTAGIKVTIHIPNNVFEPIRQQKINKIYDLLSNKNLI